MDEKPADDLKECHEIVEQLQGEKKELKEENEQLRESADAFGELAERLNVALAEERHAAEPPAAFPTVPSRPPGVKV